MASFWRVRIFGRKNFRLRWTKEPYRGVILTVHGTFLPISTMLLLMLLLLLIIRVSSSFSLILNRLFLKFKSSKLWFLLRYQTLRKWPFSRIKISLQFIDRKLKTGQRVSDNQSSFHTLFKGFNLHNIGSGRCQEMGSLFLKLWFELILSPRIKRFMIMKSQNGKVLSILRKKMGLFSSQIIAMILRVLFR